MQQLEAPVFASFADVFKTFVVRYPGIETTVGVTSVQVSLLRREADVVLRLGNQPSEALWGRRLGQMHFGAYAARSLV